MVRSSGQVNAVAIAVLVAGVGASAAPAPSGWETFLCAVNPGIGRLEREIVRVEDELARLPVRRAMTQSARLGFYSGLLPAGSPPPWVRIDLGEPVPIDSVVLVAANKPFRSHSGVGFGFPRRVTVELAVREDFSDAIRIADRMPIEHDLYVVVSAGPSRVARYVRATAVDPWSFEDASAFAMGELMALSGTRNVAAALPATALSASATAPPTYEWSLENLVDGQSLIGIPAAGFGSPSMGYISPPSANAAARAWVCVDLGRVESIDEVRLIPAWAGLIPGQRLRHFPARFRVEVAVSAEFADATVLFDTGTTNWIDPGPNPVVARAGGAKGQYVRFVSTLASGVPGDYRLALAEVQVVAGGVNVAAGRPATAAESEERPPAWSSANLTDGVADGRPLMEWPEYIDLLTTASRWTRERDRLQDNLRRRIEITGALTAGFLWGGGLLGLAGVGWITRQRIVYRRTMRRMRDEILRDMHDDVGSGLGAVAILSQIGADEANLPDQTRSDLAEINQLAREMNDAIRDMAWLSRAEGDRLRPLADSCRDIARTLLPGLDVRIEPTERAPERRLPLRVRRDMLLFAKETLHNIARHARAGTVRVRLDASDGVMRLSIEDDGIGFDPRTVAEGTGLRSMRHRADSMNGRLTVDSRPGDGARLTLEVPLP